MAAGRTPPPTAASVASAALVCGEVNELGCNDPLQRPRQWAPRYGWAMGPGGLEHEVCQDLLDDSILKSEGGGSHAPVILGTEQAAGL